MFQKQMLTQDGSPLLALPSEIRTSILMHLVMSAEAIPVAHESDSEPQQVHLTVLRVCQQLYHEGLELFIKHNIPRVSVTLYPTEVWVLDWHNGRDGPVKNITYNEFLRDTISRFSGLRFEFCESPGLVVGTPGIRRPSILRRLRDSSEWLRRCNLLDKDVTFAFDSKLVELLKLDDLPLYRHWMLIFDTIRCRKFRLPGFDGALVTELTRVVEGRLSVPDLKVACRELMEHFDRCRAVTGYSERAVGFENRLEYDLKEATNRRDTAGFDKARVAIMSYCEELFDKFRRRHEELKAAAACPLLVG